MDKYSGAKGQTK